jgi:predicted chitinase
MEGKLVENPDLAIQPDIAARIFVSWLKQNQAGYREALQARDLKLVFRKLHGSPNGVETFTQTFQLGEALLK